MLCENDIYHWIDEVHIVLILVIVEYALWANEMMRESRKRLGLNPCYSGICSVSKTNVAKEDFYEVLILVIVEYALWVRIKYY